MAEIDATARLERYFEFGFASPVAVLLRSDLAANVTVDEVVDLIEFVTEN